MNKEKNSARIAIILPKMDDRAIKNKIWWELQEASKNFPHAGKITKTYHVEIPTHFKEALMKGLNKTRTILVDHDAYVKPTQAMLQAFKEVATIGIPFNNIALNKNKIMHQILIYDNSDFIANKIKHSKDVDVEGDLLIVDESDGLITQIAYDLVREIWASATEHYDEGYKVVYAKEGPQGLGKPFTVMGSDIMFIGNPARCGFALKFVTTGRSNDYPPIPDWFMKLNLNQIEILVKKLKAPTNSPESLWGFLYDECGDLVDKYCTSEREMYINGWMGKFMDMAIGDIHPEDMDEQTEEASAAAIDALLEKAVMNLLQTQNN